MKAKYYILFIILAIAMSCSGPTKQESETTQKEPLKYNVVYQSKIVQDTNYYLIDHQYPFFVSDDENFSTKLSVLNERIKYFVDVANFTYWGVNAKEAIKIVKESETAGKYELLNRYELLDTTNQMISLKFETYSYALGAHGFTGINTYNLDLGKGMLRRLKDVVDISTSGNLEKFNQLLVSAFINPDDCFNETPAIDANYEKFAFSSDFLVIYFEAYELGSYACGSAEIMISIDELKAMGMWEL